MKSSIKYLLIATITFISGYFFLKSAYFSSQENPFANEIVLIVLGTIATIVLTSALLNKQSEIELEKEQRVKIFELKSSLYFELINLIESLILKNEITTKDLIHIEFLTHKISVIANIDVLQEYAFFVKTIKKIAKDTDITNLESHELSVKLNKLCAKIRYDLITKEDNTYDLEKLKPFQRN